MKRMKARRMAIFKSDGTIKETELKIMNFRPVGANKNGDPDILNKQWEEVRDRTHNHQNKFTHSGMNIL